MRVTIFAGGWGQRYLGGDSREVEVPDNATALSCALAAGLPEEEIGFLALDGARVAPDAPVQNWQEVRVYAQVMGG